MATLGLIGVHGINPCSTKGTVCQPELGSSIRRVYVSIDVVRERYLSESDIETYQINPPLELSTSRGLVHRPSPPIVRPPNRIQRSSSTISDRHQRNPPSAPSNTPYSSPFDRDAFSRPCIACRIYQYVSVCLQKRTWPD